MSYRQRYVRQYVITVVVLVLFAIYVYFGGSLK
jgi:hypothetical protein